MRISLQLSLNPAQAWMSTDNEYAKSWHLAEMQGVFCYRKFICTLCAINRNFGEYVV